MAVIGAGSFASSLAPALVDAGYAVREVIARSKSRRRAEILAAKVGAHVATLESATLDAQLLWFCVPDREIGGASAVIAGRLAMRAGVRASSAPRHARSFAFHSSGAMLSRELDPLRKVGASIASVHPLMTFVAGAHPSFADVPFALEGETVAVNLAQRMVRHLGGKSFVLPAKRKAAYHAWATMTSPLLLAYLVTLEEASRMAGLKSETARKMCFPIIRQTLMNYATLGPGDSFSGPFIRGDAETVSKHLALLSKNQRVRSVYLSLARAAVNLLPVKNRKDLLREFDREVGGSIDVMPGS